MTALALITGTLFWLVVFFCLMAAAFVFIKDDFGYRGALEAAAVLGIMVVVGAPLAMVARRLSGRAMASAAAEAIDEVEPPQQSPDRRRPRRRRR